MYESNFVIIEKSLEHSDKTEITLKFTQHETLL